MFRKKKDLGQHFLKDAIYIDKFVSSIKENGQYVEIGPGEGALTEKLPDDTILIEFDNDLIPILEKKFPNKKIIHANAQDYDFSQIGDNLVIIGNLPFNVATGILENLCLYSKNIKEMILAFQKEVAQKLVLPISDRNRGSLTLFTDNFFDKEYLFTIPKGSFSPPPKVETGVIRFISKDPTIKDIKKLNTVLKHLFSHPRKKIRNNLKGLVKDTDKILEECGISPDIRPSHLTIEKIKCIIDKIWI